MNINTHIQLLKKEIIRNDRLMHRYRQVGKAHQAKIVEACMEGSKAKVKELEAQARFEARRPPAIDGYDLGSTAAVVSLFGIAALGLLYFSMWIHSFFVEVL